MTGRVGAALAAVSAAAVADVSLDLGDCASVSDADAGSGSDAGSGVGSGMSAGILLIVAILSLLSWKKRNRGWVFLLLSPLACIDD